MPDINYKLASKDVLDPLVTQADVSLTNLVTNGDFSNGITGWITYSTWSTISASANTLKVLKNTSEVIVGQGLSNTIPLGRKIYIGASIRSNRDISNSGRFKLINSSTNVAVAPNVESNFSLTTSWKHYSTILTPTVDIKGVVIASPLQTTDGDYIEVQNVKTIDLTATFGTGNEPTKEEMDTLINLVPNQWWNGVLKPSQRLLLNWELAKIREKANIAQEAWITLTLINGATVVNGEVVQIRRDVFGNVEIRGKVLRGSISIFANIPIGYRPIGRSLYFPSAQENNTAFVRICVSTLGELLCFTTATSYADLATIRYAIN